MAMRHGSYVSDGTGNYLAVEQHRDTHALRLAVVRDTTCVICGWRAIGTFPCGPHANKNDGWPLFYTTIACPECGNTPGPQFWLDMLTEAVATGRAA